MENPQQQTRAMLVYFRSKYGEVWQEKY